MKNDTYYDAQHLQRYSKTMQLIKRLNPQSAKILDFGTARGGFAEMLKDEGCDVYAVDISSVVSENMDNYDNLGLSVRVYNGKLPFPDGFFDCVVMGEVVEHIEHRPHDAFNEIHRTLKKGGTLILTTPNVLRLENRVKILLGVTIYSNLDDFLGLRRWEIHHREYTKKEIEHLLLKFKFTKINATIKSFISARTKPKRFIQSLMNVFTSPFNSLKTTIIAIGKK